MGAMLFRKFSSQYSNSRRKTTSSFFSVCCAVSIVIILATMCTRPVPPSPNSLPHRNSLEARLALLNVEAPQDESNVQLEPEFELPVESVPNRCDGRRIYTYDLPPTMNTQILDRCSGELVEWIQFCDHRSNFGFGAVVNTTVETFRTDWYGTDAYMLEVIFFERMRNYACKTTDPREADVFFIPFFAGLDALPYLYTDEKRRQQQGRDLLAWLAANAKGTWDRYGGRDHFMIAGRTAWDFSRKMTELDAWGTSLFTNPEMVEVTAMVLERKPWMSTEAAIPYPVGFHPSSTTSLQSWIEVVKSSPRKFLFSFSGALRPEMSWSIRGFLSQQCTDAGVACSRLDCGKIKCSHEPEPIYTQLLKATFCLQPRGDTATRRGTFDSIVSGCIPVFFHEDTAHTQYHWHLPSDYENFAVFIDEEKLKDGSANIQRILESYTPSQVERMRARLISIIPNVLYRHPSMADSMRDAFDITIDGMAKKVASFKAANPVDG